LKITLTIGLLRSQLPGAGLFVAKIKVFIRICIVIKIQMKKDWEWAILKGVSKPKSWSSLLFDTFFPFFNKILIKI